jgi:hypothetical protein
MIDNTPELGTVSLDLAEGAAKLGFFDALGQRLLQQTTEPVLLPLNPEDVLNFLSGTRARNRGVQEHAPHDLVACEPARASDMFEVRCVRVSEAHRDPMFEIPHLTSIDIAIALSREKNVSRARISRRR